MSDRLTSLFQAEVERIRIPDPQVSATIGRGKSLVRRRRIAAATIALAIVAVAAVVVPRVDLLNDAAPVPPAERDQERPKDHTLLSIDSARSDLSSDDVFVMVNFSPSAMVCFSLPKWVDEAVIRDASGGTVATFPSEMGIRETDTAGLSCGPGDDSVLEALALSPAEHEMEIRGAGGSTTATLQIERSWNDGPSTDETELLEYQASEAIDRGDLEAATQLGEQRLDNATGGPNWDYGNAIHYGHLILGHVALRRGDVEQAKEQLLRAGRTPGSPQLNSFGPNMSLARDLLLKGEKEVVLTYIDLVADFWELDDELEDWVNQIRNGEPPNFGSNVGTGYLEPKPVPE